MEKPLCSGLYAHRLHMLTHLLTKKNREGEKNTKCAHNKLAKQIMSKMSQCNHLLSIWMILSAPAKKNHFNSVYDSMVVMDSLDFVWSAANELLNFRIFV